MKSILGSLINNTNVKVNELMTLFYNCIDQYCFSLNNIVYSINREFNMDNPLSYHLEETFLNTLKKKIHNPPFSKKFTYWYRYLDDVIICFKSSIRQEEAKNISSIL